MFLRGNLIGLIVDAVDDRSARGIAAAISRMITAGTLPAGTRLPTVRDVARQLGVSPTTVSEAWRSLTRAGVLQTRGRSGTFVATVSSRQRLRYSQMGAVGAVAQDLSTGVPDHDLLPDLTDALKRIGDGRLTSSYLDAPVLPGLEEVLRARWPFAPSSLTVVDGALDALDRVIGVSVRFGDHVVVENPAFPPLLDLLQTVGATVIGVPVDKSGMSPEGLAAALASHPVVAVFLQPRAHNPTGVSMTAARASALAKIIESYPDVLVVEDDHAGDIASAPPVSLATPQTVHVASFSKSHGPDLRLAAVGGPAPVISAVADRRLLGPGWSSRLLQAVLLDLLTDPAAAAQVSDAREMYATRRAALLAALHARGVTATADDGINLWMAVDDQQMAMVALAAHGIAVAPGAPFCVTPLPSDHVRVTAGLVPTEVDDLADALAAAALLDSRGSGPRTRPHPRGWR
ncbi:DNA-binding transcriptional regulator, MocR family, contains an aminotransferase domain [Paractinoplanes atraurantiacus]|uniref:DNA-binding transcriptional regulator, MocR family, contains an aminotransferase domain n=1 Tax=Paractinoplanes atraurantiacus TaxID=1036182 RepID=A0A285KL29_9ACTN|nr:DNA-binding transcriptional regulator, MocR family, contains an aminotransferase domain [Actinoplanes atraurantiacus]